MNLNHDMLILARDIRGMTQKELVDATGISQARISRYEAGIKDIAEDDLFRISDALEFPPGFFMREGSRLGTDSGILFHRRRQSVPVRDLKRIDGQLNKRRFEVVDLLKQLDSIASYSIPVLKTDEYGDPEEIAAIVRNLWKMPSGPVHNLVRQLEAASCIIFQFDFGTDKIDDAVQWIYPTPPIILVNNRAPWDRLRFTLARSLGHLVMHQGEYYPEMEDEANAFAAAFLMPSKDIREDLQVVTLDSMLSIKPYWKVSAQALIRRARDLDEISERRYTSLNQMISRTGYKKKEPVILPPEYSESMQALRDVYMKQLDYSISEFAELVQLNVKEARLWYEINAPHLNIVIRGAGQHRKSS